MLFYLLAASLLMWTGRLTISLVSTILPDMPYAPVFALALFDFGVFIWLAVYIYKAAGISQRIISILMTLADLVGVGLVSILEIYMGGQELVDIPAEMPEMAILALGIWTMLNLAAVVAFHLTDPQSTEAIIIGVERDKIRSAALVALENSMSEIAEELGQELGADLKASVLASMRLADPTRSNGASPKDKRVKAGRS